MDTYTFVTDSVGAEIDARDDDEAAREFAASEGIPGIKGLAGLLGWIAERGGYATVHDGRGDIVATVDPNSGEIAIFPRHNKAVSIGRKIGLAMARDAKAEEMSTGWTGLDAQDGDAATAAGLVPDTEEWEVMEEAAKREFLRAIPA